jgi:branched-chain amino acid transport system ATP-binding protein
LDYSPSKNSKILEINGVSKTFLGLQALKDVTFAVGERQIHGLIGPNGAGKSTLFNLITGLLPVTSGSIHFQGQRIDHHPTHQIARLGIARTFQNIRLFKTMTVWENVRMAQNIHTRSGISSLFLPGGQGERQLRERAAELLQRLELYEKRNQASTSLSYGEQRRLEIARALASDPRLLLLDEPAAGMNETESDHLLARICEIRDMGITVLLIEHDMKVIMGICERISVLNFGCLIADGTPQEIQSNSDVIDAYLGIEEEEQAHA